ncbi:hypothetical protein Agub_g5826, partial [Astrephomene gubernaculifera]
SLLRRALLAPPPHLAPGCPPTAVLPYLGDTHLAIAVLLPSPPPSSSFASTSEPPPGDDGSRGGGGAALKLLEGLRGGGGGCDGDGTAGGTDLPYAQLQRVVAMECYCHCLRALLPAGGGSGAERLALMQQPLGALLEQVRQLLPQEAPAAQGSAPAAAAPPPDPERAHAAAAAVLAAGVLAAARDSRLVRQHVPHVDAAQFCGGDSTYRRQAILQQAALAGQTEAAALQQSASPPAPQQSGRELLAQARQLAAVYGVDPWDVELQYTCALITSAPAVTDELRATVHACTAPSTEQQHLPPLLLSRPLPLLSHLASAVYP